MFLRTFIYSLLAAFLLFTACNSKSTVKDEDITAFIDDSKYSPEVVAASREILEDKKNAEKWYRRAFAFFAEKKFSDAEKDINQAVSLDGSNAIYQLLKAKVLFELNKVTESYAAFEKASSLDPQNATIWQDWGRVQFILKEYDKSSKSFDKVLALKGPYAPAFFYKGMIAKEREDTTAAIGQFENSVEQDPDYYDSHVQLGGLYAARKDKRAEDYFANALRLVPGSLEVLYARGLYYQDAGRFAEAIKDYESMIEINPLGRTPYYNIGYVYFLQENPDLGINYFDEAIKIDDTYVEAIYMKGLCNEMKGNILAAIESYQRCLELAPTFTLAQEGLDRRKIKSNVQVKKKE